ncbi:hypothetical protein B566_EDAN009576 [Ephemera danica]|nr:hypothetical protein B566_EDAN009576 [Ephemera danica]
MTGPVDLSKVPLKALGPRTLDDICVKLDSKKILISDDGKLRDWRGLADAVGLPGDEITALGCLQNPTYKVLEQWQKLKDPQIAASLANLVDILASIDRWDIADDTEALIVRVSNIATISVKDAETYLSRDTEQVKESLSLLNTLTEDDLWRGEGEKPQLYDALLLHAEEDEEKAIGILNSLEKRGLKICIKQRDLLVGTLEHFAQLRLMADRCNRVIAIFSNAFLKTDLNIHLVAYAQAIGITQDHRKVIPVVFEECNVPVELNYCFRLRYTQSNALYNFEDKLFTSVCPSHKLLPLANANRSQGALPKTTQQKKEAPASKENKPTSNEATLCATLPEVPNHEPTESGYQSDSSKEDIAVTKPKKKSKIAKIFKRLGYKTKA